MEEIPASHVWLPDGNGLNELKNTALVYWIYCDLFIFWIPIVTVKASNLNCLGDGIVWKNGKQHDENHSTQNAADYPGSSKLTTWKETS